MKNIKNHIFDLYDTYGKELINVRKKQREFIKFIGEHQFDDVESELLYLLGRAYEPKHCVELGSLSCWSTSWLMNAIRKNQNGDKNIGHIYSYDKLDSTINWSSGNYLRELAGVDDRNHIGAFNISKGKGKGIPIRTLNLGNVYDTINHNQFHNHMVDFLFVDALHSKDLLTSDKITPIIFHDVFVDSPTLPAEDIKKGCDEARVILEWLSDNNIEYFTPASCFEEQFNELKLKRNREIGIGLNGNIHPNSEKNSMILFFVGRGK